LIKTDQHRTVHVDNRYAHLLGLGLAVLLNTDVPGRGWIRVALLIPWVVPSVVAVASWRRLVEDRSGLVNVVLESVGLDPVYFLSSPNTAMAAVIIVKIWRSFPFMMIALLAALQSLDHELYEAAAIDGATRWRAFVHITLPQIQTMSIVLWILMTIWTVNDFDTPWLLTQGGPSNSTENLIVLAYRQTFVGTNVGMGSAVAFATLVILAALSVVLLRKRRDPA
jgi:ABC-type sugar transport system permease subunit